MNDKTLKYWKEFLESDFGLSDTESFSVWLRGNKKLNFLESIEHLTIMEDVYGKNRVFKNK